MRDTILTEILSRKGAVKQISSACKVSHAAVSRWTRVPARHLAIVSNLTGYTPDVLRPDLSELDEGRSARGRAAA